MSSLIVFFFIQLIFAFIYIKKITISYFLKINVWSFHRTEFQIQIIMNLSAMVFAI